MAKKEKVYDFGKLGKWSETTLNEQKKAEFYRRYPEVRTYTIPLIEEKYEKLHKDVSREYTYWRNKRMYFPTARIIESHMNNMNDFKERCNKLYENYKEYQKVMEKYTEVEIKEG